MSRDDLFRSEAIAQRSQQFLGPILLLRPLSFRLITCGAAVLAISLVALLFFGEYTQKANITGTLTPREGVAHVKTTTAGVIVDVRVKEGDSVRKGDVLFVLSAERTSAGGGDTQAAITAKIRERHDELVGERARQHKLVEHEQEALGAKLRDLQAERIELEAQISAQGARVELFDQVLSRFETLQREGHVSALQVQQKREEGLTEQAALHALKRERLALDREIKQLQNDLQTQPLRLSSQVSSIDRELAEVGQQLASAEAAREFVLAAHQDGVITAINAERGTAVSADARLGTIVPRGATLEAQLHASSREIGFVEAGKRVLLRYHAYPYQKFGQYEGHVVAVTRTTLSSEADQQRASDSARYRIHVALASQQVSGGGEQYALQPGMQVDAAVLLDRRRLIEWVFAPVLGFRERMADAS